MGSGTPARPAGRDLLQPGEPGARTPVHAPPLQRVTVVDIDMSMGSMISFMVKWAIAAIPAAFLLFALFMALAALFGGLGALAL